MSNIVSITADKDILNCSPTKKDTITFTVSNIVGRIQRIGFRAMPDAPLTQGMINVLGQPERRLVADATETIEVSVNVPKTLAPGTYSFYLLVFDSDEPGERFDESAVVTVNVAADAVAQPRKGMPWMWIAAGVLGVALVGGIGTKLYLDHQKQSLVENASSSAESAAIAAFRAKASGEKALSASKAFAEDAEAAASTAKAKSDEIIAMAKVAQNFAREAASGAEQTQRGLVAAQAEVNAIQTKLSALKTTAGKHKREVDKAQQNFNEKNQKLSAAVTQSRAVNNAVLFLPLGGVINSAVNSAAISTLKVQESAALNLLNRQKKDYTVASDKVRQAQIDLAAAQTRFDSFRNAGRDADGKKRAAEAARAATEAMESAQSDFTQAEESVNVARDGVGVALTNAVQAQQDARAEFTIVKESIDIIGESEIDQTMRDNLQQLSDDVRGAANDTSAIVDEIEKLRDDTDVSADKVKAAVTLATRAIDGLARIR